VIQEWWGLNEQIKKTADRLAKPVDRPLCRTSTRQARQGADEASHLMRASTFPMPAEQHSPARLQYLKQSSKKSAVGASAWAVRWAILAAVASRRWTPVLCFYGIPDLPPPI